MRTQKIVTEQVVCEAVQRSFDQLIREDGHLFDCPIEEDVPYDARKLHEVCVNHRLANHLEKEILPTLDFHEMLFVDIEFNREGLRYKNARINGDEKKVRPDIIIHNRRTGCEKLNFLVVECKKYDAPENDKKGDLQKIHALMEDDKYQYDFGLQVVYKRDSVEGTLYFRKGDGIASEKVHSSQRSLRSS